MSRNFKSTENFFEISGLQRRETGLYTAYRQRLHNIHWYAVRRTPSAMLPCRLVTCRLAPEIKAGVRQQTDGMLQQHSLFLERRRLDALSRTVTTSHLISTPQLGRLYLRHSASPASAAVHILLTLYSAEAIIVSHRII